jgi:DNA polymerase
MFLGQCPGKVEEALGNPFMGPAGELLEEWLDWAGVSIGSLYITNAVKCRPVAPKGSGKQNIDPTTSEISTCSSRFLEEEVRCLDPKLIIACGKIAAYTLGGLDKLTDPVTPLAGTTKFLEFAGSTREVYFILHPAALLHAQNQGQQLVDKLVQGYTDCFTYLGTRIKSILQAEQIQEL